MEKALQIESKEISKLFEDGMQSMRMNYYPPYPQPEQVIGLTPHSDAVGLTILLQVSQVEGLQVKKDGMWVPVKPLPNAFIVNIGDMLEVSVLLKLAEQFNLLILSNTTYKRASSKLVLYMFSWLSYNHSLALSLFSLS